MRKFVSFSCKNSWLFKQNLLEICTQREHAVVLNSNGYSENARWLTADSNFDFLAALDIIGPNYSTLEQLHTYAQKQNDWLFGYIGYDAKNSIEKSLQSKNSDRINFDELFFFTPRFVIIAENNTVKIGYNSNYNEENDVATLFNSIERVTQQALPHGEQITITQMVDKEQYIDTVNQIKEEIHQGNIYEINYCMEFYGENCAINSSLTFAKLQTLSPTPFSAFLKQDNRYLLSASPERYIKKWGEKLISQPIKGTIKRGDSLPSDQELKQELRNNPKEQAENIMITDLVRNDLSKVAKRGTVKVEELMGLYSFPQVHQLISTVSAQVDKSLNWVDILKATFPMGSMTGAPKIKAMQLIDKYEVTKRGLYSGALGYVTPEGNFDFNVVIRSLMYNSAHRKLSFMVGSAITVSSVPEKEYEECLLKASALLKVINVEL